MPPAQPHGAAIPLRAEDPGPHHHRPESRSGGFTSPSPCACAPGGA
jgi:hypothetical protein